MALTPKGGLRVLLELSKADAATGALYRGKILTPISCTDFFVQIDASAQVTITRPVASSHDPQALVSPTEDAADRGIELLRAIARTAGKHAVDTSPPAWPRRVLRWRRG